MYSDILGCLCLLRLRQNPTLESPHELIRLLSKSKSQDGVWQDSGQMREESLVDGEDALGSNRLAEAVDDTLVEVTILVVQTRHDGVWALLLAWPRRPGLYIMVHGIAHLEDA
jgi:hypothetical protein